MQIEYYTQREIEIIKESSIIASNIHKEIEAIIHIGINFLELDKKIEELILKYGGTPSFKNYMSFPFSSCISVNECVAHGFPLNLEWKKEDIIKIDIGVKKDNYIGGDCCRTYYFGENPEILSLIKITQDNQRKVSNFLTIEAVPNKTKLSEVIAQGEKFFSEKGYFAIRELVGHGIGRLPHQNPLIPNYEDSLKEKGFKDYVLRPGLVFTYEPIIINQKDYELTGFSNLATPLYIEHKLSAQVEEVYAVTKNKVLQLTY